MSESKVEEVARAICTVSGDRWESTSPRYHETCKRLARAAIAAMRTPTSHMIDAYYNSVEDQGVAKGRFNPLRAYSAMIDEALVEPTKQVLSTGTKAD